MHKPALLLAIGMVFAAGSCAAAGYKCADDKTADRLTQHDIGIKDREAAIAEMRTEIKDGGGATQEQEKALKGFEDKLAKVKADREALLSQCARTAAP